MRVYNLLITVYLKKKWFVDLVIDKLARIYTNHNVWHYINHYCNMHTGRWGIVLAVNPMLATAGDCGMGLLYLYGVFICDLLVKDMGFNEVDEYII